MKETDAISHEGRVTDIRENCAIIQLVQEEACSTCSARGACGISESDKKTFEVPNQSYRLGQAVRVEISPSTATKALITAYLIPFLLVFAVLILLISSGIQEGLSGLVSLAVLPAYYLFIRSWLSNHATSFELNVIKQ